MLSFMNLYVELQLTETYNYCSSNHKFPAKIKGNRGGKKKKKKISGHPSQLSEGPSIYKML